MEFAKGTLPWAVNLPLMNDHERARVGTCYKQQGPEAAIALGHELVSGDVKAQRLAAWQDFIDAHPQAVLFCFRGGLRSQLVQQWLAEAGLHIPLVAGGYKALRQHLMAINEQAAQRPLFVVAGTTGSGKTDFIHRFPQAVDLEDLACHRGSAFGRRVTPQPSPVTFENRLAMALRGQTGPLLLEDESRLIGSVAVPLALHRAMTKAPIFLLEAPLAERVERIHQQYIQQNLAEQQTRLAPDAAFNAFAEGLQASLKGISRRLGDQRYRQLAELMSAALTAQQQQGDNSGHRQWIAQLLTDYYDPMYHYQLDKLQQRIVARGSADQLAATLTAALAAR